MPSSLEITEVSGLLILARTLSLRQIGGFLQSSYHYCTVIFHRHIETVTLNWSRSTTKHKKMVIVDQTKCLHKRAEVFSFSMMLQSMVCLASFLLSYFCHHCCESVITLPRIYVPKITRKHSFKSIFWCLTFRLTCIPFSYQHIFYFTIQILQK